MEDLEKAVERYAAIQNLVPGGGRCARAGSGRGGYGTALL